MTEPTFDDLLREVTDRRPAECCGVCPEILGGGYDCTCLDNPRCPGFQPHVPTLYAVERYLRGRGNRAEDIADGVRDWARSLE